MEHRQNRNHPMTPRCADPAEQELFEQRCARQRSVLPAGITVTVKPNGEEKVVIHPPNALIVSTPKK